VKKVKLKFISIRGNEKLIRTELWISPFLIIIPIIVSFYLILDWYYRGFSLGISTYDGQLFLGIVIFIGNIIFDIPFIKSHLVLSKK